MKIAILSIALLWPAVVGMAAENSPSEYKRNLPDRDTPEAAVYRGHIVFNHYCVLCHGTKADGNGRAARIHNPRPANLVMSDKNDAYMRLIIQRGGGMLGRSEFMPPWGEELSDEQISDVVAFLRSINKRKP